MSRGTGRTTRRLLDAAVQARNSDVFFVCATTREALFYCTEFCDLFKGDRVSHTQVKIGSNRIKFVWFNYNCEGLAGQVIFDHNTWYNLQKAPLGHTCRQLILWDKVQRRLKQ